MRTPSASGTPPGETGAPSAVSGAAAGPGRRWWAPANSTIRAWPGATPAAESRRSEPGSAPMENGVRSTVTTRGGPSALAISRRAVFRDKRLPPPVASRQYGAGRGRTQTGQATRDRKTEETPVRSGLDAGLLADLEAGVEILQGIDDSAVLQLFVADHGRPEESLLADGDRLAGSDLAHMVPERVIECVRGLGEPAVLHRKGDAGDDRRAVEEGDGGVHLDRHERPVVAAAAEAGDVMGQAERREHFAGGRELALHADQHDRVVLAGVLARDVVQPGGGDDGRDLSGRAGPDRLNHEAMVVAQEGGH